MPDQGDIVLIPIPFTDLSSKRRRPVIVISNNSYNHKTQDMVVVALTSNPQAVDYSFTITSADLTQGTLNRPGKVRVDKIYTFRTLPQLPDSAQRGTRKSGAFDRYG